MRLRTIFAAAIFFAPAASPLLAQESHSPAVTILLPPRLVAGRPATLAVIGSDGRLSPNVEVEMAQTLRVTTDRNGRALFVVPADKNYLVAKASGTTAAALVEFQKPSPQTVSVPSVVSLRQDFSICGAGFNPDPDANRVKINGEFALVVAASSECIVVLPAIKSGAGMAKLDVEAPDPQNPSSFVTSMLDTVLVGLEFSAPNPALQPGNKSRFVVTVKGISGRLSLGIQNATPDILQFRSGDSLTLQTSGGAQNVASFEVKALRSGDFSFRARVLPLPDATTASQFLAAAATVAPPAVQKELNNLNRDALNRPKDLAKIRARIEALLMSSTGEDLRALLSEADTALQ